MVDIDRENWFYRGDLVALLLAFNSISAKVIHYPSTLRVYLLDMPKFDGWHRFYIYRDVAIPDENLAKFALWIMAEVDKMLREIYKIVVDRLEESSCQT